MLAVVLLLFAAIMLLAALVVRVRTPVRYTVEKLDLPELDDGIVVRRDPDGPTGWVLIGDQDDLLKKFSEPVQLSGGVPPTSKHLALDNRYYCVAEYVGPYLSGAAGDGGEQSAEFDDFYVYEWYPMFPIKRIVTLPESWFSAAYLSRFDQNPRWPLGAKQWEEPAVAEDTPPEEEEATKAAKNRTSD